MRSILLGLIMTSSIRAGDTAPDFTATDTEGRTHTLSESVAKGTVIVAFFPRAFTPG